MNNFRHLTSNMYSFEDSDPICSIVSTWQETGRVVLEKVTDKKKNIQDAKLRILPLTMTLCFRLLPYSCYPDDAEVDRLCKVFAKEMEESLRRSRTLGSSKFCSHLA